MDLGLPLIGITGYFVDKNEIGPNERVRGLPGQDWALFTMDYVRSVTRAGGLPSLLPVVGDINPAEVVQRLDGLLLTGGVDIDPGLYGERALGKMGKVNPERDKFELGLLKEALRQRKPVFGICRGMQLLNVGLGGTLYQDLTTQFSSAAPHVYLQFPKWHATHTVHFESRSKLQRVYNTGNLPVNSFHHQAVKGIAPGIHITAISDDGVIEGIELSDAEFVVGVQWHPEMTTERSDRQLLIFEAFVDAARRS